MIDPSKMDIGDQELSKYGDDINITKALFPNDFVFGGATSAYQVEGAYNKGGKGENNWDNFSLVKPYKILDGSNGCAALEQYHRYKEDILLMKKVGLKAYRFSISWSRLLPRGTINAGINKEGIKYYNEVIDFCIAHGLEPYVTIFHFDTPQCLDDRYLGFLDRQIIKDFTDYANLCFWEFGDRVKHWITINEPASFAINGYVTGALAPGRGNASGVPPPEHYGVPQALGHRHPAISNDVVTRAGLSEGDAGTEPYIVGHNMLLAHASAVRLYKKRYQKIQGGIIGITNQSFWFMPYDESKPEDVEAAGRAIDFVYGWFLSPLVFGHYPESMQKAVGDRLPKFTDEERTLLTGSYDFLGVNYYTANYVIDVPNPPGPITYFTDQRLATTGVKNGVPIGPSPGSPWLYLYPEGFHQLLKYTKEKYNNPVIYVTENGMSTKDDLKLTLEESLNDDIRIWSTFRHLYAMKRAMDIKGDGVNVKGYFMWSVLDNYEFAEGYTARFGIFYIDYRNGLARHPKKSAYWWMNFLKFIDDTSPKRSPMHIKESEENSVINNESEKRLKRTRV